MQMHRSLHFGHTAREAYSGAAVHHKSPSRDDGLFAFHRFCFLPFGGSTLRLRASCAGCWRDPSRSPSALVLASEAERPLGLYLDRSASSSCRQTSSLNVIPPP